MRDTMKHQGSRAVGKALLRVARGLAGLLLVAAVVLLASWLWPVPAVQKRALAALEAPQERPGSNAYATLALLGVEGLTPEQRQARVDAHARAFERWYVAEYVPRFNAISMGTMDEEAVALPPPLLAAGEAPPVASPVLCSFGQAAECLERVRRQPQAVASALVPQAAVLAQMDEMAVHGHYHSPLTQGEMTPWPAMGPLQVPLGAHALAHVRGDSPRALAGLCRDAGSGRMLMAHGDNLLTTMVGSAMLVANEALFAAVLAELPLDAPLPAACATAFAPLSPDEAGICNGMRGEFAMQRGLATLMDRKIQDTQRLGVLFYSGRKTLARTAETLGDACLPEARQAIAEDRRLPAPPARVLAWWRPECLVNSIGCILGNIAAPAYGGYANRQQDTAAQVRLLGAVLWLREHAARDAATPLAERLDGLPAELRSAHRPITVSADGTALETPSYTRRDDMEMLRVPLPQAMLAR